MNRLVLVVIAALPFVLMTVIQPAFASSSLQLEKPVNISKNPTSSIGQKMLVAGQDVYVAWSDKEMTTAKSNGSSNILDIYFKTSHDNGTTFGQAIKLSDGALNFSPIIAASGHDVYVFWIQQVEGGKNMALFRASHDGGSTFEPLKNFGNTGFSYAPVDIAVSGSNVYLVFEHPVTNGTEMVLRVSHNNGLNFSEPFVYRNGPCFGVAPHVTAWENNVYVTANDPCKDHPSFLFRASHDNGTTFSEPLYLGNTSLLSTVITKENFVFLTWTENNSVSFRMSSDYGKSFGPTKYLHAKVGLQRILPDMTVADKNDVYVIWQANLRPGNNLFNDLNGTSYFDKYFKSHLYFTASHDSGASFGPVIQLDTAEEDSIAPVIVAAKNDLFVVWHNVSLVTNPGSGTILLRGSSDKGASFGNTVTIDNHTRGELGNIVPDAAISGDMIYISWPHNPSTGAPSEVYVQRARLTEN